MITFPPYAADDKNVISGPARVWYAPYVPNGADPATDDIEPIGAFAEDAIEIDEKKTFADLKSDLSGFPLTTRLTDREIELKVTWQELNSSNLNVALGDQPESLTPPPDPIIGGGDWFNILEAGGIPTTAPPFRQWLFQFPSAGFDGTTTPKAAYSYIQIYKGCVVQHGPIKVGRKHYGMLQTTIRGYRDLTIADAFNSVFQWVTKSPS